MSFAPAYHTPVFVLKKLCKLYELLQQEKSYFEKLSNLIADQTSQRVLKALANDILLYVNELSSHIKSMGGDAEKFTHFDMSKDGEATTTLPVFPLINDDHLKECTVMERSIADAYRDALNDFNLYGDTRNILRYQLNGIMYGHLQVKMLNYAARPAKRPTASL